MRRGANVVIHYRGSVREATALAAALNAQRAGSVALLQADLLDVRALAPLVAQAAAAFGRLDVLVNNASSFYATPVGEITHEQWLDLIGTNLMAPVFLVQAAAPHLRAQHGLVLNMVDVHGLRALKRFPVYSAAKAGLVMLTRSLARELGPEIRVNAIAPGPVMFPPDLDAKAQANIVDATILKRRGSPEDVAEAALYFCAHAPYVTGQVLAVDGGRSISS